MAFVASLGGLEENALSVGMNEGAHEAALRRVAELEADVVAKQVLIDRLTARILSKDREFQQERDRWRSKERDYQRLIKEAKRGPARLPA